MRKYQSNRYTKIEDLDQDDLLVRQQFVKSDKLYYPRYHLAPKCGLLNDPNGLIYHNGIYHIFYQYCPNGPFHGLKSWNLVTTTDFINYQDHGIILHSTEFEENYGVYSGSAVIINQQINLIYTANHRDPAEDYKRAPYQMIAVLDDNYRVISKRVIATPNFEFHTEHFRDPVVVNSRQLMIGVQDVNGHGQIGFLNYSEDNYHGTPQFQFQTNNLNLDSYMIECPNWFQTEDHDVLICSPQGLKPQAANYRNVHDVVYSVGANNELTTMNWENHLYHPVDYGFDFYAPQLFTADQRVIMFGWLGLPDTDYPLDEQNGWSQMLTIPRQLKLQAGKLIQVPLPEVYNLFTSYQPMDSKFKLEGRSFNLQFEAAADFQFKLGNDQYYLTLRLVGNKLVLDRSNCQTELSPKFGVERVINDITGTLKIDCFVDCSAIEIYINDGQYVMTSRFYIEALDNIDCIAVDNLRIGYSNGINIKEYNE